MDEKKFRHVLDELRFIELEDHGRVAVMHPENMDLTEEQKKIIDHEFFKSRTIQRTEPFYFVNGGAF